MVGCRVCAVCAFCNVVTRVHSLAQARLRSGVSVGFLACQVDTPMTLVGSRSQCWELPWSARGVIKCATRAIGNTLSGLRGQQ
jgi:hypothetical protein